MITGLIIGFLIGVAISPLAIKAFKILYNKLSKNVDKI